MKMVTEDNWAQSDLGTAISLSASHALARLVGTRPLLMIGGVHGDEPLGVHLAQNTLSYLGEDAKRPQPEVQLPWALIPILNVDGYRAKTRVNGRGVDLNRNYPSASWSPDCEKARYHPGPSAGSEAEIKAVVRFIDAFQPRLIIHFHSWRPMIVAAGAPSLRDAERLARASGYAVVPEIGYPTPGSLSQYAWVDRKIPVICIEESDDTPAAKVWPNFASGLREIFLDASPR